MKEDDLTFIRGKLMMLEFFMEVLCAQSYAHLSESEAEETLAAIVLKARQAWVADGADTSELDELLIIGARASEMSAKLAAKILDRASDIRDQMM